MRPNPLKHDLADVLAPLPRTRLGSYRLPPEGRGRGGTHPPPPHGEPLPMWEDWIAAPPLVSGSQVSRALG